MHSNSEPTKLIVLDRDGVINHDSDSYIKAVEEWVPIPGSLEAIARLNHADYRVVIATNQSGLGRGYFNIDTFNAIHRRMQRELLVFGAQVEAVFFCPHTPETGCQCRKPRPGLLEDISKRLQVDMVGVPFVGDSLKDVQAAAIVGASPVLVLTGKGHKAIEQLTGDLLGVPVYRDLASAADALLTSVAPQP